MTILKKPPQHYMAIALILAKKAQKLNEVPVGALIVHQKTGEILVQDYNKMQKQHNLLCHAEMNVINKACKMLRQSILSDYELYVTLEPCPLCAAAISMSRIARVYFGAYDPKSGAIDHGIQFFRQKSCHHKPESYGGILERDCGTLLQDFFKDKRAPSK